MNRREAVLSAALVVVVALLMRAVFATQIVFPKPEDTAYYVGVARNLLEGRGLVSDALWSFTTPPLVFPRPAFEVWLPLPTFLAVIPMGLLGTSFAAAQFSSVLVGSVVPVLAWRLGADVATERGLAPDRARSLALGVGLTSAVFLPLVLNSALPDSTMPFAVIVLGACLLMTRILATPRDGRSTDVRLLGLGLLLGLGALTRNETAWLALLWVGLAWFGCAATPRVRLRLIAVVGIVALLVYAPWAIRNLVVFGSPFPGQALTNAFFRTGFDVFAWNDVPTLAKHLALGPARLVELRLEGLGHNLFNVLFFLGLPISAIGLVALPWGGRAHALRPLVLFSLTVFLFTSLVFPAATQWGTYLHAAGATHVLIVVSALLALDAGIARLGVRMGWTKPITWLGAALGIFGSALFSIALLASFGAGSRDTARFYDELAVRMAGAGHPLDETTGPVISNFPIWLAETRRIPSLALPDEPPQDVLDMAATFPGTRLLVLINPEGEHWPADLAAEAPGSECFREIDLGQDASLSLELDPLGATTVYEISCP